MRRSTVRWIAIALVAALILGVGALALIGLTDDPRDRPPRTPPVSLGMPRAPGPVESRPTLRDGEARAGFTSRPGLEA